MMIRLGQTGLGLVALSLAATGCTGLLQGGTISVGTNGSVGTTGHAVQQAPEPAHASLHASAEVRVEFFGVDLTGANDVVFVLDRSGSMGGPATGVHGDQVGMNRTESALTGLGLHLANAAAGGAVPSKMEVAKQELLQALASMPDGTLVNVVFFGDSVASAFGQLTALNPATRGQLTGFINGTEEDGGTSAVPALDSAYAMGARRVVFLSDGLANRGGDGDDLLVRARTQIASGVRFDTVGVGFDQDGGLLASLAQESGGVNVMR